MTSFSEEDLLFKTVPKLPIKVLYQSNYANFNTDKGMYLDLFADGCNLIGPVEISYLTPTHISHIFQHQNRIEVSNNLRYVCGMNGKIFWVNSGTEAIETAIKLCRKRFFDLHGEQNTVIVGLQNGFHGRTLGALSYSDTPEHYKTGFGPFFNSPMILIGESLEALVHIIDDVPVAGIIIECIQGGEGNVMALPKYWVKEMFEICKKHEVPIICDEIQTFARIGEWNAYSYYDVEPNIVCISKGIAGGLPCGIVIADSQFNDTLNYGEHFSTLGGSPFICQIVSNVLDAIMDYDLLSNSERIGEEFAYELLNLDGIIGVRQHGLFIAVDTIFDSREFAKRCLDKKLVICGVRPTHFKLMPPLNIRKTDVSSALQIMDDVAKGMSK